MPDRLQIGSEELSYYAMKASARLGRTQVRAEDYEMLARADEGVQHYYAAASYYVLAEAASGEDEEEAARYAALRARALDHLRKPCAPTLW